MIFINVPLICAISTIKNGYWDSNFVNKISVIFIGKRDRTEVRMSLRTDLITILP